MSVTLRALLKVAKVAVISGGDWPQFQEQLLANLPEDEGLKHERGPGARTGLADDHALCIA